MSVIVQQPDALSFAGNLKKFIVTSGAAVSFQLSKGAELILNEIYQPGVDNIVEMDLRAVIDKVLSVTLPGTTLITDQSSGVADFTAMVDGTAIDFRVIKGGVAELQELASVFVNDHFLTWQIQDKKILQVQPEWLTVYTNDVRNLRAKAYYQDNTDASMLITALDAGKLLAIDVSWSSINALFVKKNPVAWDVWFEDGAGTQLSYVQRYQLRNSAEEEKIFIWANTLGGIDTISLTGSAEDDKKLDHLIAEMGDESLLGYQTDKKREIKQSTGFLTTDESRWMEDFFYSGRRYLVGADGAVRSIVLASSKVVSSTADDLFDYEFTYRYASDNQLLNLDRTLDPLPAPEALDSFFLAELLSGLTSALYADNLFMAVQSPFAQGWQKLSFAQLWGAALPTLVDGITTMVFNGQLRALASKEFDAAALEELKKYLASFMVNSASDARSMLISGAIVWKTALTYTSTDIVYQILGVKYTAQAKDITLTPADPNLSRIDLFYVDAFGSLQVKNGTPAINPASPVLNSTQLEVMTVLIAPGALVPSDVNIEKVYDEHTLEEWATSEVHNNNIAVDFNSADATLNGSKRIKIAIVIPNTAIDAPLHFIGEKYQGGVIFWLSADGKSGLICSLEDTAIDVFWSPLSGFSVYTTGAAGLAIGTGAANSALMLANDAAKDQAVRYCNDLMIGIYNDWFMPSEKELDAMYFRRYVIGNFATKTYWSSTESAWNKARCISFGNGVAYTRDKNNRYCVRAIRAFDDNTLPTNQPIASYNITDTSLIFEAPAPVDVTGGILSLNIKSSLPWLQNSILLIESFLGSVRMGSVAISPATNLFGYKPEDDTWQMVALNMFNFAPSKPTLDAFKISLIGSWPNNIDLGFDDIRFQHSNIVTAADVLPGGKSIVEFAVATSTPSIENYNRDYAPKYGQYPTVKLFTIDTDGNRQESDQKPIFEMVDGLISKIKYDIGSGITGFIIIS